MKTTILKSRSLIPTFACALLFPTSLHAVVQFTFTQEGDDVVLSASGSYGNLNGLTITPGGYIGTTSAILKDTSFNPATYFYSGAVGGTVQVAEATGFTLNRIGDSVIPVLAPTGGWAVADETSITGTGNSLVQLNSDGTIRLNLAYDDVNDVQHDAVSYSGTSTWYNTTLEQLGLSTGSYEVRWDSGNQGINYTVVPEPSTAVLSALCVFGWVARRRR